MKLTDDYEQSIRLMDNILKGDAAVRVRRFEPCGRRACLYFSDGSASSSLLAESIIRPLMCHRGPLPSKHVLEHISARVLEAPEVKLTLETEDMTRALACGDALLFVEGQGGCLIVGSKGFVFRSVEEPEDEQVARGPREGFVEPLMINLSMLKRRLRTDKLKTEMLTLGDKTATACCICYIEGTADAAVLRAVREKVRAVRMDGVLSSNYVSELMSDHPFSIFKRIGTTARPDVAAAKLLEGRVAIMTDGSPQVLTVPFVFLEHFQSAEDYYLPYHNAAFARVLRLAGFLASVILVPAYVAILNFHPGSLSTSMIVNMALSQESTPFSAVVEAVLLLLSFDLLREAGQRTPSSIGQTLSIVGALVLGQSAVEAKIASPPMVILVALSGVTGLIISDLKNQIIILRLVLLLFAHNAGLWGCVMGLSLIAGRLASAESFGVDYLMAMPLVRQGSREDGLFRTPFSLMKKSGRFMARDGEE